MGDGIMGEDQRVVGLKYCRPHSGLTFCRPHLWPVADRSIDCIRLPRPPAFSGLPHSLSFVLTYACRTKLVNQLSGGTLTTASTMLLSGIEG